MNLIFKIVTLTMWFKCFNNIDQVKKKKKGYSLLECMNIIEEC